MRLWAECGRACAPGYAQAPPKQGANRCICAPHVAAAPSAGRNPRAAWRHPDALGAVDASPRSHCRRHFLAHLPTTGLQVRAALPARARERERHGLPADRRDDARAARRRGALLHAARPRGAARGPRVRPGRRGRERRQLCRALPAAGAVVWFVLCVGVVVGQAGAPLD